MRRLALLLLAASILSLVAFDGPAGAKTTKPTKVTSCQKDKKIDANIAAAFDTYLSGVTPADQLKYVEDGAKILPFSEATRQDAANNGQTSTDTKVVSFGLMATCDGKKAATFSYDLALNVPRAATTPPTAGAGLHFSGDAVLNSKTGQWYISALTVCDLLGQGNQDRGLQCAAAVS